jgi:hypothetical protein
VTSPFHVYGPFQFDKKKVQDKNYRKAKWDECDSKHAGLREAKGVYLYSLKNKLCASIRRHNEQAGF